LGIVSGPVEGILTLCIMYAFTAYVGGGSFWNRAVLETFHLAKPSWYPESLYNLSWTDTYMIYGGIMLVANTVWSAQNVQKARRDRGQRARVALLGLLPFFGVWALIPIYLALNPLILSQHIVPFVFYVGLINAYSVGTMITAHLTKSRFPYYNPLVIPLLFGIVDSMGPVLTKYVGFGWPSALGHDVYQVSFMFLSLGLAIGIYGSFVVDVIFTICDYLDIWCLKIKHPFVSPIPEKKAVEGANGSKKEL